MKTESEIREEIRKYENSIEETNRNIIAEKEWVKKAKIVIEQLNWVLLDIPEEIPKPKLKEKFIYDSDGLHTVVSKSNDL